MREGSIGVERLGNAASILFVVWKVEKLGHISNSRCCGGKIGDHKMDALCLGEAGSNRKTEWALKGLPRMPWHWL